MVLHWLDPTRNKACSVCDRRLDASTSRRVTSVSVTLLDALYAFYREHEHCGELDSAVEGNRVWMTCTCGAAISRRVDDE